MISDTGTRSQVKPKPRAAHISARPSPPCRFHPAALLPRRALPELTRRAAALPGRSEPCGCRAGLGATATAPPQPPAAGASPGPDSGGSRPPPPSGWARDHARAARPHGPADPAARPTIGPAPPPPRAGPFPAAPPRCSGAAAAAERGHGRTDTLTLRRPGHRRQAPLTSVTCPRARRRPPICRAPAPPPPHGAPPLPLADSAPVLPPSRHSCALIGQYHRSSTAAPPLDTPPTALPFVERCHWLAGLQEVPADWLVAGRPLGCGRGPNGSGPRGAAEAGRALRAVGGGKGRQGAGPALQGLPAPPSSPHPLPHKIPSC